MTDGKEKLPLRWNRLGAWLAAAAVLLAAATALYALWHPVDVPPAQPIAFSHRVHAGDKRIGCFYCHEGARDTARAGVPAVQRCMQCHQQIIVTHPEVQIVRRHYFDNQPIEWNRVNRLPEFVHFTHQMHVQYGFDCSWCHGNVKAMDRVRLENNFLMGFCLDCHRRNGATHDCFACHR